MKIAIIGAGWYGCHLALVLKAEGHEVTIYDKKEDILHGTSGDFSIRLHVGAHYPRSEATQDSCQRDKVSFTAAYPEFIVSHDYAIYALGKVDALGIASRVDVEQFDAVCRRLHGEKLLKIEGFDFGNTSTMDVAYNFDEPSLVIGKGARELMKKKLKAANIRIFCNQAISQVTVTPDGAMIYIPNNELASYDYVINATGYQDFVPEDAKKQFPVDMSVVYQPCLGLLYNDLKAAKKPMSFIVMDGFYPCLMPHIDEMPFKSNYILTHGAYTILNSCDMPDEAYKVLHGLTDDFVASTIKALSEKDMTRFWPHFSERFQYIGWKGAVLAKIKTRKEFRSAVAFERDRIIHVIPGKISNVMTIGEEVKALLKNEHCLTERGVRFIQGGSLDKARLEIKDKPSSNEPSTCNLQTYDVLKKCSHYIGPFFNPKKTIPSVDAIINPSESGPTDGLRV